MKPWMRWIVFPALALVSVFLIAYGYGSAQSPEVHANAMVEIGKPAAVVYALLADPNEIAKWHPGIEAVELISQAPRRYRLKAQGAYGGIEVVQEAPPLRLVTKSLEAHMGVSGVWDATLVPTAAGCRVQMQATITMPPLLRALVVMMDPAAEELKTLQLLKKYAER